MVSKGRWQNAQSYEQGYWDQVAREVGEGNRGQLDFYQWRANQLAERLRRLGLSELTGGDARVLEVGCGPVGIVSFFPASERVAVDPLEDFYSSRPALVAVRDTSVSYRAGTGEQVPADDDAFDLVIIENCIDHCQDMQAVMTDIKRVLAPGGILYLTVNARSRFGYYLHRLLSRLKIDAGHPHTFTFARTVRFIESNGFEVLGLERESWWKAWVGDLTGDGLRAKAKGILGVSEFVVSVVARLPS